jgi:hypothetical protein
LNDGQKHCDTCLYSYYAEENSERQVDHRLRQHCRNPRYNAPGYTQEMFLEDRQLSHCRFWLPKNTERIVEP